MPHRKVAIRDLLGREFLPLKEHGKFFGRLLAAWGKDLSKDRKPVQLRRLIESLRKSNYEFGIVDGKAVPVAFKPSAEDEAEDIALSQEASKNLQFMNLPLQCRRVLDAGTPIPAAQVEPLADLIRSAHEKGERKVDPVHTAQDVVLGGVAVLVCLHYDWLVSNPIWLAWCHERLEEALKTPGIRPGFYSDINSGNDKWDAFAGECGVSLLARDRSDQLARKVVAQGITGLFCSTTQLVVTRATQIHAALGDDFKRLVAAVLEWSAMRPLINAYRPDLTIEIEQWAKQKTALEKRFVDGSLKPTLPDFRKLNAGARKKLDEIYATQHAGHAAFLKSQARGKNAEGSRIKLHPEPLGFDVKLVRAGLFWLRPDAVTPFSRLEIITIIRTLLEIVITSVPLVTDRKTEEIEGLPSEFDRWVYELVATAIPLLTPAETPENLWKPILNLGAPAHRWVERFYWDWFILSWKASSNLADFCREWRAMIELALASPEWDRRTGIMRLTRWDTALRTAFFEIIKILAARGSHAALALQGRVSSRTLE